MSKAMKQRCDCGCYREQYHSQLVVVTIEQAIDPSLRQTSTSQRFWVLRECKEKFEEELGMMVLLNQLVRAWPPPPKTRWWLINAWLNPLYPWPTRLRSWWRRVGAAKKVMQLQHAIYERPNKIRFGEKEGFERTRQKAMQSAILFGAPRFLQGFLANRFLIRAKRKASKDATRAPTIVTKAEA